MAKKDLPILSAERISNSGGPYFSQTSLRLFAHSRTTQTNNVIRLFSEIVYNIE